MKRYSRRVLIFWHDQFDEVATSIFVAELRTMGFKVCVVGLGGARTRGKHGLRLVPDMTMSEALAVRDEVGIVILPCDGWSEAAATYDPRLRELLTAVAGQNARLISSPAVLMALSEWLSPVIAPQLAAYPANDALVPFVRVLASSL